MARRPLRRSATLSASVEFRGSDRGVATTSRVLPRLRVRFRGALWVLLALQLAGNLADLAVCSSGPCRPREVGQLTTTTAADAPSLATAEGGGEPAPAYASLPRLCEAQYATALLVRQGLMVACLCFVVGHFGVKLADFFAYAARTLPARVTGIASCICNLTPRARPLLPRRLPADFWVAAASPGLFRETEDVMRVGNTFTGLLMFAFLGLQLCSYAASGPAGFSGDLAAAGPDGVYGCRGSPICIAGGLMNYRLLVINAILGIMIALPLHTSPGLLWSHTMRLAQVETGSLRFKRLQWQPWLAAISYFGFSIHLSVFVVHSLSDRFPATNRAALFVAQSVHTAYLLWAAWWCLCFSDVFHLLRGGRRNHVGVNRHALCQDTLLGRLSSLSNHSEFSLGQQQEALLMIQLVLWSSRVISNMPLVEFSLTYAIRGGFALLLFLSTEKETTVSELGVGELNFGLVVQARALKAALQGRKLLKVPLYSATIHRMQDALAVSYKWQADEREIMPGLNLNMSDFQMETLAEAIDTYGVRYVWLDKLSVPQTDSAEKDTLLSRMMGVYAAARMTLAIRTREDDSFQYHQRAWTFQEFCSSSRLLVVTEEGGDMEDGRRAVDKGSEANVMRLRSQCQKAMNNLTPMWLRKSDESVTSEQAVNLVQEYEQLSAHLYCLHPGDMLRALWPLLANTPVESQRALVALIKEVALAAGQEPLHWLGQLFESNIAHRVSMDFMEKAVRVSAGVQPEDTDGPSRRSLSYPAPRSSVDYSHRTSLLSTRLTIPACRISMDLRSQATTAPSSDIAYLLDVEDTRKGSNTFAESIPIYALPTVHTPSHPSGDQTSLLLPGEVQKC